MEDSRMLRPDRLMVLIGMSSSAVLMLLFGGGSYAEYMLPIAMALAPVAVVGELWHRRDRTGLRYAAPAFSTPLIFLVALASLSVFWSADVGLTLRALPAYLMGLLSFWIMSRTVEKQRRAALFIVLLLGVLMVSYSLYDYAFLAQRLDLGPAFPFFSHEPFPALAAFVLALSLGHLSYVWIGGEQVSEAASGAAGIAVMVVAAAGAVVSAGALCFVRSQMAYVAVVAILVALVAVRGRRDLLKSSSLAVGAVVMGLIFARALSSYASTAAREVPFLPALSGQTAGTGFSFEYLSYHWLIALRLGAQRLISGFGAGTFERALPLAFVPSDFHPGASAQSFLLQLFADLGLLGAISFIAFSLSALFSLMRRIRRNDAEAVFLSGPFIALAISLLIGGGYTAPAVLMLFFMTAGAASAGTGERRGKFKPGGILPIMLMLGASIATVALCSASFLAVKAKSDAVHYLEHGEYEEAMPALTRAAELNPFDSELYTYLASAELRQANAGAEGHSADAALRYAEIAVDLSPYSPDALQLRGLILKQVVEDGSWLEDFKAASSFAADEMAPSLALVDEGLRSGDLSLAGEYIEIARLNEPLLASEAGTDSAGGLSDLSDLIKLEAMSYALAVESGDVEGAGTRLEALRSYEEQYPEVHGFIEALMERYGLEDPLH